MSYSQYCLLKAVAQKSGVSFKEVYTQMKLALQEYGISVYSFLDVIIPQCTVL